MKQLTLHIVPSPDKMEDISKILRIIATNMEQMTSLPTVLALRNENGDLLGAVTFGQVEIPI